VLKGLSGKLPTYLLSNTNALHIEHIRARYAFPAIVKGAILSHELKLRKPQLEIYEAALKLSGTAPEETVFIDDLEENCAGARKAGLHAIRYRGAKDSRRGSAPWDCGRRLFAETVRRTRTGASSGRQDFFLAAH
jgi:putative hydrolase of the HAD superfamily